MFRGRFVHTLDTKGRVSLPAAFRTELQRRSDRPPILTNLQGCLALYSYEDWEEIERKLSEVSAMQQEVQAFQRFMVSGAVESPVDKQGRILIAPHLREHAGLIKEATIAGVGPRVEIWDKARFDQDLANTQARYDEISDVVARLGL